MIPKVDYIIYFTPNMKSIPGKYCDQTVSPLNGT